MPLEFRGVFATQGTISIGSQEQNAPPEASYYYSFDNSVVRDIYINTTSRSNYFDLSSDIALQAGDTITFNVPVDRSDIDYVWLSGNNFELAFNTSGVPGEINCEIVEVNSRTNRQDILDFFDDIKSNNTDRYCSIELLITGSCTINRIGGPQNTGVQNTSPGTFRNDGLLGIPIINVKINTQSNGSYFWSLGDKNAGATQPEELQSGPTISIASYNSALWNGSAHSGLTAIHLNTDAEIDPGDDPIMWLGSADQLSVMETSIINSSGQAVKAEGRDFANITLPVDLSTGFTISYDAIFETLGSRNGNITSGGVKAAANSSTTTRWSLIADNYDGSGVTSIAFSILNDSVYRNISEYASDVLSEVRDPTPLVLGQSYRIIAVARPSPVSQIELYINDQLIGTSVYPANVEDGSVYSQFRDIFEIRFGRQYVDGVFLNTNTVIDEFRFYDRPLTAQEILSFKI